MQTYVSSFLHAIFFGKPFLLLFCILIGFSSCSSDSDARRVGERFYENIRNDNFERAVAMCDASAFDEIPESHWLRILQNKRKSSGVLLSYDVLASGNMAIETTVYTRVKYKVVYENTTLFERIDFVQRPSDGEPAVLGYAFFNSEAELFAEDE
ncbi:MAG: hypothetical protein JJT94_13080 [Bernardetiaceae bacterium]|nr:hypothetical protein [Bernardetiaceae bacterium]